MHLQVDIVQPDDAAAGRLIRAQIRELMETWQHRVVSEDEVDAELGPQPMAGVALVALARRGGAAVGCGGLRVVDAIGELTKVYVVPAARGTGVGEAVVGAVEEAARGPGPAVDAPGYACRPARPRTAVPAARIPGGHALA